MDPQTIPFDPENSPVAAEFHGFPLQPLAALGVPCGPNRGEYHFNGPRILHCMGPQQDPEQQNPLIRFYGSGTDVLHTALWIKSALEGVQSIPLEPRIVCDMCLNGVGVYKGAFLGLLLGSGGPHQLAWMVVSVSN